MQTDDFLQVNEEFTLQLKFPLRFCGFLNINCNHLTFLHKILLWPILVLQFVQLEAEIVLVQALKFHKVLIEHLFNFCMQDNSKEY